MHSVLTFAFYVDTIVLPATQKVELHHLHNYWIKVLVKGKV